MIMIKSETNSSNKENYETSKGSSDKVKEEDKAKDK